MTDQCLLVFECSLGCAITYVVAWLVSPLHMLISSLCFCILITAIPLCVHGIPSLPQGQVARLQRLNVFHSHVVSRTGVVHAAFLAGAGR